MCERESERKRAKQKEREVCERMGERVREMRARIGARDVCVREVRETLRRCGCRGRPCACLLQAVAGQRAHAAAGHVCVCDVCDCKEPRSDFDFKRNTEPRTQELATEA